MTEVIEPDLSASYENQHINHLDYYFSKAIQESTGENNSVVLMSCALVSKALSHGSICLNIPKLAGTTIPLGEDNRLVFKFAEQREWISTLQASKVVGKNTAFPLVLDEQNRLYLSKYYDFQQRLVKNLCERALLPDHNLDEALVTHQLNDLFKNVTKTGPVKTQINAIKNSLLKNFVIISGGPGTGKTYCTNIIKFVLKDHARQKGFKEPKIISLAPTGKAASKLANGATIHSVLRPLGDRPGFFYNKNNLIQADTVIIDEASMIDIALMTRLLEAIPLNTRLILLGDKNQLTSVEAGSVLSEICSVRGFSHLFFNLEYNFRYKGKSGIENLSQSILNNDIPLVEKILLSKSHKDILFEQPSEKTSLNNLIEQPIIEGYKNFLKEEDSLSSLKTLENFRILCAHNTGWHGTRKINETCEKILRSRRNSAIQGSFFKKAIMITSNDYEKGLFNGDTGIIIFKDGIKTAAFRGMDNKLIFWRYSDLPSHATAFAVTVHKSQGSEFDSILIIIPDKISPVLTRQLLYTGVTRAREKVHIIGRMDVIKKALNASVDRESGLKWALDNALKIKRNKMG